MNNKKANTPVREEESLSFKISFVYSVVMLFAFPLFLLDNYSSVTKGKYSFFLISTITLAILLALSYVITIGETKVKTKSRIDFSISKILLAAYTLSNILSVILSKFKGVENSAGKSALLFGMGRYNGLITFLFLIAACFIVAYAGGFKKSVPVFSAAAVLAISVMGIIQLGGTNFAGFYPASKHNGFYHEFIATIGNIDFLSSLFCILIPLIVAAGVILDYHPAFRIGMFFSASLGLYTMLATEVQSGMVGMAAFMLVFIPVMTLKKEWLTKGLTAIGFLMLALFGKLSVSYRYVLEESKTYTDFSFSKLGIAFLIAGAMLIAAGLMLDGKINNYNGKIIAIAAATAEVLVIFGIVSYLAFFYNVENGSGLAKEIASFLQGKLTLHSGSRRVAIWKYSFEMGMENPIFGNGVGVFKEAFRISKGAAYALVSKNALDMAHNDYLQIFCDSGILGLVLYMGYLVTTFVRAIKYSVKSSTVVVLMLAAFCYLVQIFFSFNIIIVSPVFWVIMGLLEYETVKAKNT